MSEFGDKLEEAEAIATQALEMRRQIFGEDHSRTLSCQAVLARIHFRQGQLDRARVTQEKIDSIQRRTLGGLYVRTRAVRKDLALTYQSLGRFAEAEQVYRQVIEVGVQVFGPRHFDVVSNLVNLAKVCSLLGRQTEAEDMIAEKLAEISRIPINDPSTVVMLKINLAALHVKQRRWDEARVLVRYVIAVRKSTQDPEYQLTRRDLHALNEVQETLRKEYFARCGYYLSSVFVVFLSLFLVYTQAL
jgi:tetratricopeptide (TPR) repeat protein